MEIISYVGFNNRNYNSGFNNVLSHFSALLKKQPQKSFFKQRKTKKSIVFNNQKISSNSDISNKVEFSLSKILNYSSYLLNSIITNRKTISITLGIASAIIIAIVLNIRLIDYSPKLSTPLLLKNSTSIDIEKLNKIMESFALDETKDYNPDGTLIESENTQNIQQVFSQPISLKTYKVQSGDTISGITKKFGLKNISTLIAVNDIDNVRQLAAGQKLKIPSIDGMYHNIQKGESLTSLSKKFEISIEELLDVNELDSAELQIGQKLFIPGAKLDKTSLDNAMGQLFKYPLNSKFRFSSMFGPRLDPFSGAKSYHTGIDMACPQGTPILASSSGTVSFVGYSNIYGNYIIVKHSNDYQTLYAHMSKILAKKGQWVSQGTRIGLVGSTGYSTGPHLHFSVYKNSKLVNPLILIK